MKETVSIVALVLCVLSQGLRAQTEPRVANGHAARFAQYKDLRNIRDADVATTAPAGEPVRIVVGPGHGEFDPSSVGRAWADYLESYACAADLVVIATPRSSHSEFTTEGTFIFTDYALDVEAVLRGEPAFTAATIQLSWPGGSLVHNGRQISVVDASFRPLAIKRRYLLFLRQIAPGEFGAIRETAGYDLTARQARSLGTGPMREPQDSYALEALAQAVARRCNQ